MNAITLGASAPVVFQNTRFEVVDRNGQPWLRLPQIGAALGYASPYKVQQIYERNSAEFTDSMTAIVKLPTAGGEQDVRIFSLRGAHLLAMFSRTKIAAEFRRWVLDILDRETATPALSAPAIKFSKGKPWPDPGRFKAIRNAQILDNLRDKIRRKAYTLALAQYDVIHSLVVELVTDNLKANATEAACEDYIERFGSGMGGVTLVNTYDLYQFARLTTGLLDKSGEVLAGIHRMEKHTGMALYHRQGGDLGLPDTLCEKVFDAIKRRESVDAVRK